MFTYPMVSGGGSIPPKYNDLLIWLDGSDTTTMWQDDARSIQATDYGDTVAVWDDKSPAGTNWTQTTGAYRPKVGHNCVDFYPGFLNGPNYSALTEGTLLILTRQVRIDQGGIHHIAGVHSAASVGHYAYLDQMRDCYGSGVRAAPAGTHWGVSGRPFSDVMHVSAFTQVGGEHKMYIDDDLVSTDAVAMNFGATSSIGHGVRFSAYDLTYDYLGEIHTVLMYDTVLSDSDRGKATAYLQGLATYPGYTAPSDISGLQLHLDASNRGTTTDQWDDLSGQGNHWTSASGQFPTFTGGEAIFNGTSEFLTGPTNFTSGFTAAEVFMRVKADSKAPALTQTGIWWWGTHANSCHYVHAAAVKMYAGASNVVMVVAPSHNITGYQTLDFWTAANDWGFHHGFEELYTTSTCTVAWTASPQIGKSQGPYYLDGNVKEIIMFNRKLTDLERYKMHLYMER